MQIGVLYWRIELVEPGPSNAKLPVLPDDVAATVDEEHTVVDTALFAMRGAGGCRGNAGTRHQGEVVHALGVIGADDGTRRDVARAASELPHDIATGVDLDDAIVELIGDEDVAGLVEFAGTLPLRGCHHNRIPLPMKTAAAMSPKRMKRGLFMVPPSFSALAIFDGPILTGTAQRKTGLSKLYDSEPGEIIPRL